MPFAIDPVCGNVVDPEESGLEVTANGIAFPFCSRACLEKFEKNKLDYLYCPWKPKVRRLPLMTGSPRRAMRPFWVRLRSSTWMSRW